MPDAGPIVWLVGHTGVFKHKVMVMRQREVRQPNAVFSPVIHHQGLLIEKGYAVSVQQPAYLGLTTGFIWWFELGQIILQRRIRRIQALFTCRVSWAAFWAIEVSIFSVRSMSRKSLSL